MRRLGLIHAFPWKDIDWHDSISGGKDLAGWTVTVFVEATYAGQRISLSSEHALIEEIFGE